MGAMPVGCYKQMSTIKEGVIMRLQCIREFQLVFQKLSGEELSGDLEAARI